MSVDSDRELESGDDKESDVRLFIILFHYNVEAFSCFFNHCFFFQQHSDEDFDQEEEGHNNIAKVSNQPAGQIH